MIRLFARHPTAANLLMLLIVAAGLFALPSLRRETFPDFTRLEVEVRVPYPGASAQDVESGIAQRIEDAIDGVQGVKEVRSEAQEGLAVVVAEGVEGLDITTFKDDIQTAIDGIADFPDQAEDPVVQQLSRTDMVLVLLVSGPLTEPHLKAYCEDLKDRLQQLPQVSLVEVGGFADRQLRIELDPQRLRRYGLSVQQVADAVKRQSLDLPGGTVETLDQDVLVRYAEERRTPAALESLVVKGGLGGAEVRVRDVGTVRPVFKASEDRVEVRGRRAGILRIQKTKAQDLIRVADRVKEFVKEERVRHPQVELDVTQDGSTLVRDRLQMLLTNGWQGLLLVFVSLWLFFNIRLSGWVAASLVVSFLGAFFVMPLLGLTINMMTMVGLLLALGLLMDDGIVIAENVASHWERGKEPMQAAIDGVAEVAPGVLASFLTTVCVLGPLVLIEGQIGKVLKVIPVVLIVVMAVSLIEAFLILPAHLGHALHGEPGERGRFRVWFEGRFEALRENVLGRVVDRALEYRYLTVGVVIGVFLLSIAAVAGGIVKFKPFPDMEGDVVVARVLLPQGTPLERTQAVVARVTSALGRLNARYTPAQPDQQPLIKTVQVEFNLNADAFERGPHVATVTVDLLGAETRATSLPDLQAAWRAEIGTIPDVLALTVTEPTFGPAGRAIEIRFQGAKLERLREAATATQAWVGQFEGTKNLAHDLRPGKPEVRVTLRAGSVGLGLTGDSLAKQIRAAFYGQKANDVIVRGEPTEVDVQLLAASQGSLSDLEDLQISLPNGRQAPIESVAKLTPDRGYARIARVNGQRAVTLRGDVDARRINTSDLFRLLRAEHLPTLAEQFPDVTVSFEGEVKEGATTQSSMRRSLLIGLIGVFILLSFQFRSYLEPLVVMVAIPLALIGVVAGHLLLGINLCMPSMLGFVSLAGVVVNDSILLVLFLKAGRERGEPVAESAAQASRQRFRAIVLTSLTTVAGLLPLLFEKSMQAQVLIPLAVSIAFGMMAATVLVLIVIPCVYTILGDLGLLADPAAPAAPAPEPAAPAPEPAAPAPEPAASAPEPAAPAPEPAAPAPEPAAPAPSRAADPSDATEPTAPDSEPAAPEPKVGDDPPDPSAT